MWEKHSSDNRLYRIWANMKTRCYNPKFKDWKNYGGKGVSICSEWKDDFNAFREWSIANGYSDELAIDRIDSDGDYSPENCRWTTWKQQANNTNGNRLIEYNGETHTLAEWSAVLGIRYQILINRLDRCGYSIEKAFDIKDLRRQRLITYKGKTMNLREWSDELKIPYYCLRSRLNCSHWTVEQAFETPYESYKWERKNGN